jgi:hypothetical protein
LHGAAIRRVQLPYVPLFRPDGLDQRPSAVAHTVPASTPGHGAAPLHSWRAARNRGAVSAKTSSRPHAGVRKASEASAGGARHVALYADVLRGAPPVPGASTARHTAPVNASGASGRAAWPRNASPSSNQRVNQIERHLAEIRDELTNIARSTVSLTQVQRAMELFDPIWDCSCARDPSRRGAAPLHSWRAARNRGAVSAKTSSRPHAGVRKASEASAGGRGTLLCMPTFCAGLHRSQGHRLRGTRRQSTHLVHPAEQPGRGTPHRARTSASTRSSDTSPRSGTSSRTSRGAPSRSRRSSAPWNSSIPSGTAPARGTQAGAATRSCPAHRAAPGSPCGAAQS